MCSQTIVSRELKQHIFQIFLFLDFMVLMQFSEMKTCLLAINVHIVLVCIILNIHQICGLCFNGMGRV